MNTRQQKLAIVIGYLSGFFTTFSFIPQVILVWGMRPLPAAGVSLPMYAIFCTGVVGWVVYGVLIRSAPVLFWNIITMLLATSVFCYKLFYG